MKYYLTQYMKKGPGLTLNGQLCTVPTILNQGIVGLMDIACCATQTEQANLRANLSINRTGRLATWLLKLLMLMVVIIVWVPFSPKLPGPSLDSSWALALNQALAQGLDFGKDIIFTLGPYSSIYTKSYHPATDWFMLGGSLYLGLCYWLCLIQLMNDTKWRWSLVLAAFLFCMVYSRDSLFFSYTLILGMLVFKGTLAQASSKKQSPYHNLLYCILFTPLGLLSLVKGSLLLVSMSSSLLFAGMFMLCRRRRLAYLSILIPCLSMMFFWVLCGQSIMNLPAYIQNTIILSSGFSEAMSLEGNNKEVLLYWFTSGCIIISFLFDKGLKSRNKLFLIAVYLLFLFISSKAGFTRHFGHAFIGGTSILFAALLLPFVSKLRWNLALIGLAIYSATYINGHYTKISIKDNMVSTYKAAWYGAKFRLENTHWLEQNYELALNYLKAQDKFPFLPGRTDIYSYDQTSLIAAGLNWSPRPVFQSYSAFGASVAKFNRLHLTETNRPDYIVFKIEPIDNRFPTLEDGSSWPLLLSHYQPFMIQNDTLFLKRQENRLQTKLRPHEVKNAAFLEEIVLSKTSPFVFMELDIKPTLVGRLADTLFKSDQLTIKLTMNDGSKKEYRLIPNMAKNKFLISPLIENSSEFGLLFHRDHFLNKKAVASFSVQAQHPEKNHWQNTYAIHFYDLA